MAASAFKFGSMFALARAPFALIRTWNCKSHQLGAVDVTILISSREIYVGHPYPRVRRLELDNNHRT